MNNEQNNMKSNPLSFATAAAQTAKDYAQDYGTPVKENLWEVVKQFGCDNEWDDNTRHEVYKAAMKKV